MGSRRARSVSTTYASRKIKGSIGETAKISIDRRSEIRKRFAKKEREVKKEFEDSIKNYSRKLAYNAARRYLTHTFPILGTIYDAYLFSKFAYKYVTKIQSKYEKTGDIKSAFIDTTIEMAVETIKEYSRSKIIEIGVNIMWNNFKTEYNVDVKDKALEEVIKGAMYDTISEIIGD